MRVKWWHISPGRWLAVVMAAVLFAVPASLAAEPEAEDVDYAGLGDAYAKLGRLEEALQWYERGLALKPEYVYLHVGKAQVLDVLGRSEEALASYDRALALRPDDWVILFLKGHTLARSGRQGEALGLYDRALLLYKDGRPSLQLSDAGEEKTRAVLLLLIEERVKALRELGRFEEAADGFDLFLELEPDCGDAYRAKIEALKKYGAAERAPDAHDEALARDLGDKVEYRDKVESLLEMGPEDADWYVDRGFRILADNMLEGYEYEKAAVYFDAALALDPNNAVALKFNGSALAMMGKYDDALECYDRALALDASDGGTWILKGRTLLYVGEAETALRCCDHASEEEAESTGVCLLKGAAYLMQDKYDQARTAFEKDFTLVGEEDDLLYLYVVDRAEGRAGVKRLRPLLESQRDPWGRTIARFLAGEIDAEDLLTKAGARKISLCEAHCYIGYKCKFDGDDDAARRHFEEAVATGVGWPLEYILSLHELRRLDAASE